MADVNLSGGADTPKLNDLADKKIYMDVPTTIRLIIDAYDHRPMEPYVTSFRNIIIKTFGKDVTRDIILRTFGDLDKIDEITLAKINSVFGSILTR